LHRWVTTLLVLEKNQVKYSEYIVACFGKKHRADSSSPFEPLSLKFRK